jgi:2-phosphosulfolactate phosphatase
VTSTPHHQAHAQAAHAVRMDWGPAGAAAVTADLAVVVDVLSFTTAVTVALERGIEVLPYPWRDPSAQAYAARHGAVLALGRREGRLRGAPSLSPAGLLGVTGVTRLVLPSPNGSAISATLAAGTVLAAALRNRDAVATRLAPEVDRGRTVAVIAAGERWPDGSLRPAVEDLWGAGAVLAGLVDRGVRDLSPEARVAEQAFRSVAGRLSRELAGCASGLELAAAGFAQDVAVAADLDVATVVPVLTGEAFRDTGSSEGGELGG